MSRTERRALLFHKMFLWQNSIHLPFIQLFSNTLQFVLDSAFVASFTTYSEISVVHAKPRAFIKSLSCSQIRISFPLK